MPPADAALKAELAQVQQPHSAAAGGGLLTADLIHRLATINAQIAQLRQALQAKRKESAEAVRWIKQAIADYGLSARPIEAVPSASPE